MVEDNMLVQQVLKGDRHAFQQLVERYQNYVFTITSRVLRSREEAEEAAQDVFLKVYKQLGSFEQKSKFSTWLYTIAYRTAIDFARRKNPQAFSIEDDESFLQIEDEERPGPVEEMQQQDIQDQLAEAIRQLKPVDASIITLFYLKEHTVKEVSEITGLTVTNVKTKLFRLREVLREQLSRQLHSEIEDLL